MSITMLSHLFILPSILFLLKVTRSKYFAIFSRESIHQRWSLSSVVVDIGRSLKMCTIWKEGFTHGSRKAYHLLKEKNKQERPISCYDIVVHMLEL
jgi:hypothetical protein